MIPGLPAAVKGVAVIRGAPVPVVDAACLLVGEGPEPTRFVTLKVGARHVALAVEEVLGIRTIEAAALEGLPQLLTDASQTAVSAIGTLDQQLLVVLETARLVPEAAWSAIDARGSST